MGSLTRMIVHLGRTQDSKHIGALSALETEALQIKLKSVLVPEPLSLQSVQFSVPQKPMILEGPLRSFIAGNGAPIQKLLYHNVDVWKCHMWLKMLQGHVTLEESTAEEHAVVSGHLISLGDVVVHALHLEQHLAILRPWIILDQSDDLAMI